MRNLQKIVFVLIAVFFTGTLVAQQQATITVNSKPQVVTGVSPQVTVCKGSVSSDFEITVTNAAKVVPTKYELIFSADAKTAGFIDVTNNGITVDPATGKALITVTIPADVNPGTYSAALKVWDGAKNCRSEAKTIDIKVNALPEIVPGTNITDPGKTIDLAYSTGNATGYTVKTLPAGWTSTNSGAISGSPIDANIVVPATAAVGIYNAVLTITDGTCTKDVTFPITVRPVVDAVTASVCSGTGSVDISPVVSGSPTSYRIVSTDFTPHASAAFASPLKIEGISSVPGLYSGTIYVTKDGIESEGKSIKITVHAIPTASIASGSGQEICSGLAFAAITADGGTTYQWTPVANANITGASDFAGNPLSQTLSTSLSTSQIQEYELKATQNGCTSEAVKVSVTVNPLPVASISDVTICEGENAALTVQLTQGNNSNWSFKYDVKGGALQTGALVTGSNEGSITVNNPTDNTKVNIKQVTDGKGCVRNY